MKYMSAIFFHIAYFNTTYFRALFTCIAMCETILNPAISPKVKIWTAPLFINVIVKHFNLRTYQYIALHENIKNNRNVCFRMTVATKLLKICLSNMLIDDKIIKR